MRTRKEAVNQLGLFMPEPEPWARPEFMPNWLNVPLLALDLETRDDGLNQKKGPGYAFKDHGWISGFSVSNGLKSLYFPLRHPDSDNFDVDKAYEWIRAHLTRPNGETIFHNANYDLGWIFREMGVVKPTKVSDTMAMAIMLDENRRSYSLDNLCKDSGIPGKDKSQLKEAARALGLHPMQELYKLPARFVGGYAEGDTTATYALYQHLAPKIVEEDLTRAYRLEADLIEVCTQMRMKGIRVDEELLESRYVFFIEKRDQVLADIGDRMSHTVDMGDMLSSKKLASWFYDLKIPFGSTKKGAPSFESDWLETQDHWLPRGVALARKYDQAGEKFLKGYIRDNIVDGRIHAEIHQLRDIDEDQQIGGGTRSYRFAYSNPPLQQMPARDPDVGRKIREVFLPEEGEEWFVADLDQQEPRLTVHFAAALQCPGYEKAVDYYKTVPTADYHQMTAEMAGIERKPAKIINLGLAYGMQTKKLARSLNLDYEGAAELLKQYHEELPYVNALANVCEKKAQIYGFIRLIDGARCRFDLWRPADEWSGPGYPLEKAQAMPDWHGKKLTRADARKALNRLIQGSAARQVKKAMLDLYRDGHMAMIQMHDDLSFSLKERKVIPDIVRIMCCAIKLQVPVRCKPEIGPSWGTVEKLEEYDASW
jgi:DNA polymerase I-like protein with 3'-5' exonuclease and polymerase domains